MQEEKSSALHVDISVFLLIIKIRTFCHPRKVELRRFAWTAASVKPFGLRLTVYQAQFTVKPS
jgi:hypothetical protein